MNLLKVNTFIRMRICADWSMHLLSNMLYRLSSCGLMFLFICDTVATVYVRLFIVSFKKFVTYHLFTMYKFQLITTNKKHEKNDKFSRMITTKTRIRIYRRTIWCLSLSSQACFTHFDTWILDYKNISLIVFNHFRPPYKVVTSENLLKSLIW